ncbi:MAG: cobalt ECF transporter T component CbiQ [Acidimicrobiia bacterium]
MGAGHAHALYVHEHSPLHRVAPEAKIVATLGIVVCVAITPREAVWAFGLFALTIIGLVSVSRVPPRFILARLTAITPFVVFAFFIPFIGTGETTDFLGLDLSVDGLWAAWNILAKAILGASVSIVLTATTEVADIMKGLAILRVPAVLTAIMMFMVRYLELITDELRRMRVAMMARGYDPRWLYQARPIASSAGALFVRSYERGERVHGAMLARGFTGVMPELERRRATKTEWAEVIGLVLFCAVVTTLAIVST